MTAPDRILAEDLSGILAAELPWKALYGSQILVTGASGFIGGHIVEALAWLNRCHPNAGLRIHALARNLDKLKQRLPWLSIPGEVTPAIQDVASVWHANTPTDFIIHAASPASPKHYLLNPVDTIRANTDGTRLLLELAKEQHATLLFLSSGAVYGANPLSENPIRETDFGSEDPLSPRACYSESKRLAETLCRAYHTQFGVDAKIARISHCYGPGMRPDDGRAIADILADILNNRCVQLESDGSATRPFCYVSDTVQGLFHVLLKGRAGEAYNVGETQEISILNLAQKMINAAGKKRHLTVNTQNQSAIARAPRDCGHFNIDKIKAIGWAPVVDLDTGLARMLADRVVPQPSQ